MDIAVISVNFRAPIKHTFTNMDEKISLDAIAAYGDSYAEKVSKSFFSSRNTISGPEILKLSNVSQVNMFAVRELMHAWKDEAIKMRSPYFNYEHPDVKDALNNLMAVLSNNISVNEELFLPLLKKAVRQTLLVIFNPYDFFSILVTGVDNRVDVAQFKDEIRYLKINKAPLVRLVQKLEEKGAAEISGNEAFAVLDQILEEVSFTPEDLDEHIRQFSEVLPLDPSSFFPQREEPEQASSNHVDHESIRAPQRPKPVEVPNANNGPEAKPTLNDRMQSGARTELYSHFQKISKIKDNLTINQKFMFTKVLFYGDFESFSRAVDEIDQLPDLDQALKFLETQSSNWDRESREFHEFMEMVEKRFA